MMEAFGSVAEIEQKLRISKTDSSGTQNYVTDGSSPASAVLKDGNAVYTPGLSEHRSSASKFYHGDALGSTRGITDSTQSVTDSVLYDAFGNTVSRTGTTPTPFGFVGKEQYQSDSDSGLQLLGHRYYDPSLGRFLSSDPAKAGTNWYVYCSNNPLKGIDPLGLLRIDIHIGSNGWGTVQVTFEEGDIILDPVDPSDPYSPVVPRPAHPGETLFPTPRPIHNISVGGKPGIPSGTYPVSGISDGRTGSPWKNRDVGKNWPYGPGAVKFDGLEDGRELHGYGGNAPGTGNPRTPSTPTHGCIRGGNDTIGDIIDIIGGNASQNGYGSYGNRTARMVVDNQYYGKK